MTITFVYPLFALLLLAMPLLWFFPARLTSRTHGVLRSLLVAAVILALARPVLLAPTGEAFQVFILDASGSLTAAQRQQARALSDSWLAQVKDKKKSAVIVVGAAQQESKGDASLAAFDGVDAIVSVSGTDSTSSLSAALAEAARQIPDDSPGAIAVVSDGLSTDRRWGSSVQALIRRGIAVDTADLGRDENDVYPASIRTDEVLRVGQTVRAEVQLVGRASGARVRLLDMAGNQLAISAPIDSTDLVQVPLYFEPRTAGFMTVRAEVTVAQGDSHRDNNVLDKTLAIQSPLRMLYLGERMQGGASRLGVLLGGGFVIDDGSGWDLQALPDLSPYDVAMVDDRTAARMPEAFQQHLATAVRERGLGLMFAGGKAAFGAGGYEESPLAQTLPVALQQKTEKRDPSTALAMVIDTSGSMAGNRMELAKQVARLAAQRLKAHDRVGIVEFYGNKNWALPLQPAANKIVIDRAIGRMQPLGHTVLYPGIEEAYYGLKNMSTRYKHILIVTDAGIEDADYESLVRRVARDNINVSTVLVGAQAHSQSLIDLASWGNGRFYSAADRFSLPDLILKQPSTMKLPEYKEGSFAVTARGAQGWWGDIDHRTLPALAGYVETASRPGAEVLIEVSGSAHPVLSTWHYGLGRVTALMTEPVGAGTASWRDWRDYGRMLARVLQRTADESQAFRYALERDGGRITLSARRYSSSSAHYPRAAFVDVQGPAGEEKVGASLSFRQLAPDYFVAALDIDPAAELRVSAGALDAQGQYPPRGELRMVSMPREDVARENQVDPARALDLAALTQATAGSVIDAMQPTTAKFSTGVSKQRGALQLYKLWWWALLLALLVYLGELTWRRWPRT